MRRGKRAVRFSPTLLSFAIQQACTSPQAYRTLRAACPMLPSEQTVDAFKASGDLQDSQRAAPQLLQRLGGLIAKNNRPEAKTGTLVQDEIRASCGVVYRVRTGSIVGFVTDQTYFGDIVVIEADDYSRFDSIALKNIRYLAGK